MPKPAKRSKLPLEQRIQDDAGARKALELLLAAGAKEIELRSRLGALEASLLLSFEGWSARSRLTRREAKTLAKRLSADADKIRKFFSPDLYWFLTLEQRFGWIGLVQKYLKRMAGLIEGLLLTSDDRGGDDARPAKMLLTEYVLKATGRPHDREVAELIRVTLGPQDYNADSQRKFRTRPRRTGLI